MNSAPENASPAKPKASADLVIVRPDRKPWGLDVRNNSVMEGAPEARARAAANLSHWLASARDPNAPLGDRCRAITGLALALDSPGAAEAYLAAFHDPSPHMRSAAAGFVIYSEWRDLGPRLVQETLTLATSDPDEEVRRNAQAAIIPYATDPSVFGTVVAWLTTPSVAGGMPEDNVLTTFRGSLQGLSNAQLREVYQRILVLRDRLQSKPGRDEYDEQFLSETIDAISEIKEEAARHD